MERSVQSSHRWFSTALPGSIRTLIVRLLLVVGVSALLSAETGILVVHVKDVKRHPIEGVRVGVEGEGASAFTLVDGRARIRLAPDTKEKSWISLQILQCPPQKDFVMVSPWDYRTLVPSFRNESDNFIDVVVVERGDRSALESGTFLRALTTKINEANTKAAARQMVSDPRASLEAVAKEYSLSSDEVDRRIREWGKKTTDAFEAGMVALYARKYAEASEALTDSLQAREKSLQQREKELLEDRKEVADAAFFLGSSKYQEGKYGESVAAYERCLQLRPDDATVLNNLAQSVSDTGDLRRAQQLFERALTIREALSGSESADTAQTIDSLALVLQHEARYEEAEKRYREALQIRKKLLGPEAQETITTINSLAGLLYDRGDLVNAEQQFRLALSTREKLDANSLETAQSLDSLALCLQGENKLDEAEDDYRRALQIRGNRLGTGHPAVAQSLNSLAWLLYSEHRSLQAKELYDQALDIRTRVLGPDHPLTAATLDGLGLVLQDLGDTSGAEKLIRRALGIKRQKLGDEHPETATSFDHLGLVLEMKGDLDQAETSYSKGLAVREKVLGPNHPATKISRDHVEEVRRKRMSKVLPRGESTSRSPSKPYFEEGL